jgi:hypothetical protein
MLLVQADRLSLTHKPGKDSPHAADGHRFHGADNPCSRMLGSGFLHAEDGEGDMMPNAQRLTPNATTQLRVAYATFMKDPKGIIIKLINDCNSYLAVSENFSDTVLGIIKTLLFGCTYIPFINISGYGLIASKGIAVSMCIALGLMIKILVIDWDKKKEDVPSMRPFFFSMSQSAVLGSLSLMLIGVIPALQKAADAAPLVVGISQPDLNVAIFLLLWLILVTLAMQIYMPMKIIYPHKTISFTRVGGDEYEKTD